MAEFTLLKLQLDDASFSANAPFADTGDSDGDDDSGWDGSDDEESRSLLPLVIGLVFLIALGVAAKKLLGGSEEIDVEVDVDE